MMHLVCGNCGRTITTVRPLSNDGRTVQMSCECGRRYKAKQSRVEAAITAAAGRVDGSERLVIGDGRAANRYGRDL